MIFTELSYIEFGKQIIAPGFLTFFTCVLVYRFALAFHHYIHYGDFGDFEKNAFVQSMEGGGLSNIIKYGFTGYHPGMVLIDAMLFGLFSLMASIFWGILLPIILIILLGHIMRRRIATKQEFIARLNGEYDE